MECHPEEDHHGEHEAESHDAALGLFWRKLHVVRAGGLRLRGVDIGVSEPAPASEIDSNRDHKRDARHGESHVVRRRKLVDVVRAEPVESHAGHAGVRHHGHQAGELVGSLRSDRAGHLLVGQRRNRSLVYEPRLCQELVCDGGGGGRSEHRTDVDGHIEQAERAVPFGCVPWIIVKVADQNLEIAFEQSRSDGDQQERAEHHDDSKAVGGGRNRKHKVPEEHHADARHDAFSESDFVREPSSHDRHKIDRREED